MRAGIVGIAGAVLTDDESTLIAERPPAGIILFARNIVDPSQLAALMRRLRAVLPPDAVLMIDQEGGRVARLRPPHWAAHPPAARIGAVFARDAERGARLAWLTGALIGLQCRQSGFDVVAAPLLDRQVPGADAVIGDRAYSDNPDVIAMLGRAMADGLLAGGIVPVGKHAPGHGRAGCDSHYALPVVTEQTEDDLSPFRQLADLPWMMTAHIVYPQWDADRPATLSPTLIADIIRTRIGFGGLLVSDDLAMGALSGTPAERAVAALAAGCDLALYCDGDLQASRAVLDAVPPVPRSVLDKLCAAMGQARVARQPLDAAVLAQERDRLLA